MGLKSHGLKCCLQISSPKLASVLPYKQQLPRNGLIFTVWPQNYFTTCETIWGRLILYMPLSNIHPPFRFQRAAIFGSHADVQKLTPNDPRMISAWLRSVKSLSCLLLSPDSQILPVLLYQQIVFLFRDLFFREAHRMAPNDPRHQKFPSQYLSLNPLLWPLSLDLSNIKKDLEPIHSMHGESLKLGSWSGR